MSHEAYHTEEYKGYTIKIVQDQDGRNPYEDGDGMFPMMVKGGRNFNSHDYHEASAAFYPSTNVYRRHKKALLALFGIETHIEGARFQPTANDLENELHDAIGEAVSEHDYDKLEAVGDIIGVPCLQTSSSGYSQGDYVDLLVVWTEKWGKSVGVTKDAATKDAFASMELNAKVYGAWAWGDVFGFVIEGPDGVELEDGSCWGFVEPETYPAEKMYAVQEARMVVDADILHRRKTHQEQVKTWIRSKVPFQYRVNA